jgi:protein-L-isoaspartate(D-aspartate) O-methyltransferase
MRAAPLQLHPCWCRAYSVPHTEAAATLAPALPVLGEAAGEHVGGLAQGSLAGWCAFRGGPASLRLRGGFARARRLRGPMSGWVIPPPSPPLKSDEDLRREREAKIGELERRGLLSSERLRGAMLTVAREDFIPPRYRDHAYEEIPLPLPNERATISCPHSYPLFYEPLSLGEGHRFLEVGVGSGYGTSLAREVVGPDGLVVAIDIDAATLGFARENLNRAAYTDVILVHGDGGLGYPDHAPYDRICITAACPDVPPPLIEQLMPRGRLIAPVMEGARQRLTLIEKTVHGLRREIVADVLYVSLRGRYGAGSDQHA